MIKGNTMPYACVSLLARQSYRIFNNRTVSRSARVLAAWQIALVLISLRTPCGIMLPDY
jgi:hypothetical protein